jgi:hypothetical protein
MWTEEEIQKDANEIQRKIYAMTRDYNEKSLRTIRSRITENKENTTGFFRHFYEALRISEYNMYQQLMGVSLSSTENNDTITPSSKLTYTFNEIKNSANDLPHPRILSELQRDYERNVGRHSRETTDNENNRYIPYKVYRYIREKSECCLCFKAKIGARDVSLFFITFPESHISVCSKNGSSSYLCSAEIAVYQLYAYKAFIWISMVGQLANQECSEKLDVYFYMTPFKKERPRDADDILSAIHVNTGLTRNCETHGEIVVYRSEEWFKVFVHESMHNFNMDFIDLDLREANHQLRQCFCIPHGDILLFETYTESWARIINVMFDSYFQKPTLSAAISTSGSREHFIRDVREKLVKNSLFHVYQIVKALDVMKLKYSDITSENMDVCRKRYKEDTNVYAYYILGGILSAYALPFICWCCDNNQRRSRGGIQAIRFLHSSENLERFIELICSASRDSVLLNMISFIESSASGRMNTTNSVLYKTMRMTPE